MANTNIQCGTMDSAIPPKKRYFRALIASLRNLSSAISEGKEDKSLDICKNRPISRARIEERMPHGVGGGEGRMSPAEVRDMIKENCSLIKTVDDPDKVAGIERRLKRIYENRKRGASTPDTLARYLERECDLEPWQADRIVRDQMNKFERRSELEAMRRSGVRLVRWKHGDSREPRPWHCEHYPYGLADKVFPIDEPQLIDPKKGIYGYPGDLPLCSCHLEAVE